jgi:uncharacterized protein YoxC
MDNPITFTLSDLGIALLMIAGLVLIVYLIITLVNINKTIKNVNLLIDDNRENINKTVSTVPEICGNVNDITSSVKGKVDAFDGLFESKEEAAASFDIQSVISSVTTAFDVFSQVKDMFSKKKKRKGLKRYI